MWNVPEVWSCKLEKLPDGQDYYRTLSPRTGTKSHSANLVLSPVVPDPDELKISLMLNVSRFFMNNEFVSSENHTWLFQVTLWIRFRMVLPIWTCNHLFACHITNTFTLNKLRDNI